MTDEERAARNAQCQQIIDDNLRKNPEGVRSCFTDINSIKAFYAAEGTKQ